MIAAKFKSLAFLGLVVASAAARAATFDVATTEDWSDTNPGDGVCMTAIGQCSLRAAIQESNALSGADTIVLSAGVHALTITAAYYGDAASGDLDISSDIAIIGANKTTTIIDAAAITDRAFWIHSGTVAISNVTIRNGKVNASTGGGGIYNQAGTLTLRDVSLSNNEAGSGGAIFNEGVLTLTRVGIVGNRAVDGTTSGQAGGIYHSSGTLTITDSTIENNSATLSGGIFNMSTAVIRNSTISANHATNDSATANSGEGGGGITNGSGSAGTLTMINSTVSGNLADGFGAGIVNNKGTVTLRNVTMTANRADANGSGASGTGGGLYTVNGATTRIANTIVAANQASTTSGADCQGSVASLGYNIIGNVSGCTVAANTTDQRGTASVPIDPLLEVLADNGGPTLTHALGAGSVALDAGDPAGCSDGSAALTTDQRGSLRPSNSRCDIGAYEAQLPHADAGIDRTVNINATVTLDGRNSSSASALTYQWTQLSGTSVTLKNSNTAVATFTAPATNGALVFRLTVTDTSATQDSDDITITVDTSSGGVVPPGGGPLPGSSGGSSSGGGGGCVMSKDNASFDWLLFLSVLVLVAARRKRRS